MDKPLTPREMKELLNLMNRDLEENGIEKD